jgi:hypothetical protein
MVRRPALFSTALLLAFGCGANPAPRPPPPIASEPEPPPAPAFALRASPPVPFALVAREESRYVEGDDTTSEERFMRLDGTVEVRATEDGFSIDFLVARARVHTDSAEMTEHVVFEASPTGAITGPDNVEADRFEQMLREQLWSLPQTTSSETEEAAPIRAMVSARFTAQEGDRGAWASLLRDLPVDRPEVRVVRATDAILETEESYDAAPRLEFEGLPAESPGEVAIPAQALATQLRARGTTVFSRAEPIVRFRHAVSEHVAGGMTVRRESWLRIGRPDDDTIPALAMDTPAPEPPSLDGGCPEETWVVAEHEHDPWINTNDRVFRAAVALREPAPSFDRSLGAGIRVVLTNHPLPDPVPRRLERREGNRTIREATSERDQLRLDVEVQVARRARVSAGVLVPRDLAQEAQALPYVRADLHTFIGFRVFNEGTVRLSVVEADRVCGVVDLADGRGRIRGVFVAPIRDAAPDTAPGSW